MVKYFLKSEIIFNGEQSLVLFDLIDFQTGLQKLGIILEIKVFLKLKSTKTVNNKKHFPKMIFIKIKKITRLLTLKIKFRSLIMALLGSLIEIQLNSNQRLFV